MGGGCRAPLCRDSVIPQTNGGDARAWTDAVVYGVAVPGQEGRAGMAAITTDDRFGFDALAAHLNEHVPVYAQPLFVRLCESLDFTGTFKLTKGRLVQEGYSESPEPVWFADRAAGRFVRCDPAVIRSIEKGTRRV